MKIKKVDYADYIMDSRYPIYEGVEVISNCGKFKLLLTLRFPRTLSTHSVEAIPKNSLTYFIILYRWVSAIAWRPYYQNI